MPWRRGRADGPSELAELLRLAVARHGFRRVHARCAIATLLGAVSATWVPLMIGTGGAPATARLVVGVATAAWLGGVTLNTLMLWVLVRVQPRSTAHHPDPRRDPDSPAIASGSARLGRLVVLPGAVCLTSWRDRVRHARATRDAALLAPVAGGGGSDQPRRGPVAAPRRGLAAG